VNAAALILIAICAVQGGVIGWLYGRVRDLRRRLAARSQRPRPPYSSPQAEEAYIGGKLTIGESAIAAAYVRMLDNLWRTRTGLYQSSPQYVVEKASYVQDAAGELGELVEYWRTQEPAPRWDMVMRGVKARGLWSGSAMRIVQLLEPLPWNELNRFEPPSVQCPVCFMISYHPKDIEHGFCALCGAYTSVGTSGVDLRTPELRGASA
jgi:hypothetical protein